MLGKTHRYTSDSGLISEVHEELERIKKNKWHVWEHGPRIWTESSQKKRKQWLINITKCLFSLEIREMYIKTAMKFHLSLLECKDQQNNWQYMLEMMSERGPSFIIGGIFKLLELAHILYLWLHLPILKAAIQQLCQALWLGSLTSPSYDSCLLKRSCILHDNTE